MSEFENDNLRELYSAEQISARIRELGAQITQDYADRTLVLLVILKGSFIFGSDLARAIDLPLRVEFLGVSSYGDDTRSSGVVRITQDVSKPIEGTDVLIVEDIVDTGLTIHYLAEQIHTRKPASVRICSLLNKPARSKMKVTVDYLGFTIEDKFVIGYGLDWAQRYRNLPNICEVIDPERKS